jgi:DNA-binding transcriptional regulator YiaG
MNEQPPAPQTGIDEKTLATIMAANLANIVKKVKAGKPLSKLELALINQPINKDSQKFKKGNQAAAGHATGEPKWDLRFIAMARQMAKARLIDEEIAEVLGVSVVTLNKWKHKYKAFGLALKKGKESADKQVERSLFERATGYSHPDVDIRTVSVGNGQSEIIQTPTMKHYPPDTTAAIFWLKNRKAKDWREKTEQVHQNPDGTPVNLAPTQVILTIPAGRAAGIMPTVEQPATTPPAPPADKKPR